MRWIALTVLWFAAAQWSLQRTAFAADGPSDLSAGFAADGPSDPPPGQSTFRVYGGADGLRNLVVVSIAQDSMGLLWLGTEDGVYRFDGERFTHFSVEDGLISSSATVVAVAPGGEVCVGSRAGLVCRDGSGFSQARTRGVPAVPVRTLTSHGDKLWVGTDGAGLYVQDGAGGFVAAPGWPAAATTVRALWADGEGLVAGVGSTLLVSAGDGHWRELGDLGLGRERIDGLLRDPSGALWIRSQTQVWTLARGQARATDLRDGLPTTYDVRWGSAAMVVGPHGNVLVATDHGIAYRAGDRWRILDRTSGVPATPIRTLFVDREGSLWVGSAGLFQLRGRGVVERHNVASGLPGDTVWSFRRDPAGTLWVGTNRCLVRAVAGRWECLPGTDGRGVRTMLFPPQGGVFLGGTPADLLYIDPAGKAVSLGDFEQPSGHNVLALALGPEGDLWIATRVGLYRLSGAVPGPLERVEIPGLVPGGRFASVTVADGRLWTASSRGGLAVLDRGQWQVFGTQAGFRDTSMTYIMQRRDGRLCAAYTEAIGLTCFRYNGRGVVDLEHIGRAQGLATGMVYVLGEDAEGRLWVGTGDGVDILTQRRGAADGGGAPGQAGELARGSGIDRRAGQPDGAAARAEGPAREIDSRGSGTAAVDGGGAAGRTAELGRARRSPSVAGDGAESTTGIGDLPCEIDHLDESDGLAGNDTAAMAFLLDPDGSVWLGSTGGATHVLAQHYRGPPPAPRTTILGGRLGDQPVRADSGPPREVPYDRNALTLEFGASSLLDARRVEYQMRMSPRESAWTATHQRQAHYPGLPPGSYRFEVRARVGAGAWGPATEFRFAILPAWWQSRWFLALALVGVLSAIALVFTWRHRALLRRRTRQLDEQSEASFRALIDLMPDLISVYRKRRMVYCNRAASRFFGIDPARVDWRDVDLSERVHPDDRGLIGELFARRPSGGNAGGTGAGNGAGNGAGTGGGGGAGNDSQRGAHVVEFRLQRADGSWRCCEYSGVRVEIGSAVSFVASGRDVTERKRMRAKLLVSDRMASLGTLAAGIAHEINNPLAYVTGNLEAIAESLQADQPPGGAARAELAAAIHDARDGAERVRKIVAGLRSFSRSEDEQRTPLALPGVLEAAIRLTSNEVRHRAQLVQELGPTPLVAADDGRLTQVFINLLVNAAHAIPEGRSGANRITVRTRTDDQGRAVIEVEDTGKGISPDLHARVFDPFFTTKDVGEGTGLGLSICHGIVSGLGGQIAIESPTGRGQGPLSGTIVHVVLPAAELPAAPPPAPAVEPAPSSHRHRRHRIMLVDDEPMVVQTMQRLLRRDYDVTVATCGHEAIAVITGGARFDAIVSDVMMPNMTGFELVEQLQQLAPDQARRLIFLSGGAFTAEARERLAALGAPQLEKPVSAKELRACVQRVAEVAGPAGLAGPGTGVAGAGAGVTGGSAAAGVAGQAGAAPR